MASLFAYHYETSVGSVSLPAAVEMVYSMDARRRRGLSLKSLQRQGMGLSDEVSWGSTISCLPRSSHSRKPPRRDILFGNEPAGRLVRRRVPDVLGATVSLIRQIDQLWEELTTEYGVFMNLRDPVLHFVDPDDFETDFPEFETAPDASWNRFFAGLRFPDDPHLYTLWASFGMLDLMKHDPRTGKESARQDVRSRQEIRPLNAGEIRVFRRTCDWQPLHAKLTELRELLENTADDTVAITAMSKGV